LFRVGAILEGRAVSIANKQECMHGRIRKDDFDVLQRSTAPPKQIQEIMKRQNL
jgi:hypothetical protein